MLLLALFAFLAGAGTALSPCVLPILPAVLSAGVTGGRRRPLGVVIGLALTFTFAVVGLAYVIDLLGLPADFIRTVAIVVLLVFGITLMIPPVADRLEAWISRIVPATQNRRGDGFGTGLLVGASLGIVYTPCAGPILAGVITVSASQTFTAGKLFVALAYAAGSAAVLYLLVIGGRRISGRLKAFQSRIQIALGAVMVIFAVAMLDNLDVRFQNAIATSLPGFLTDPTSSLENSNAVAQQLAKVRGGSGHVAHEGGAAQADEGLKLPDYGPAPELIPGGQWFNSSPLTLSRLEQQGRVILIDFWTYTCINCLRTLPYVEAWDSQYRDKGLTVIGVHTPEFQFEHDAGNVAQAISDLGIHYPVVQDNNYATWTAFGNQYWPAHYLIDSSGEVRYVKFGEGDYSTTESAIRSLLAEGGTTNLGREHKIHAQGFDPATRTPETYFGAAKAQGFITPVRPGTHDYGSPDPATLRLNQLAYGGTWKVTQDEGATAVQDTSISLHFQARRVFCVMGSPSSPGQVQVLLDGKPISSADAGDDVTNGAATVSGQRLYSLVSLPEAGQHVLTLQFDPGVSGYSFTFG